MFQCDAAHGHKFSCTSWLSREPYPLNIFLGGLNSWSSSTLLACEPWKAWTSDWIFVTADRLIVLFSVLRIRIHRIHVFLGLLDPEPDPSIIKQNSKKNLDFYCFVASFWLFTFEKWCKSTFNKLYAEKLFFKLVFYWHLEGQWW